MLVFCVELESVPWTIPARIGLAPSLKHDGMTVASPADHRRLHLEEETRMHPERLRCRVTLAIPKRLWQRPWAAVAFVRLLTWGAAPAFLGALWLLSVPAD